jgi:hypothetical protein
VQLAEMENQGAKILEKTRAVVCFRIATLNIPVLFPYVTSSRFPKDQRDRRIHEFPCFVTRTHEHQIVL